MLTDLAGGSNRPLVLVAEDDPQIAKMLSRFLEASGFAVRVAHDGRAALNEAVTFSPAVILLDLTMPVMDGWQFIHAYRQTGARQAPIVLVSAIDNLPFRAKEMGAAAWFSKPCDMKALLMEVMRLTTPIWGAPAVERPVEVR